MHRSLAPGRSSVIHLSPIEASALLTSRALSADPSGWTSPVSFGNSSSTLNQGKPIEWASGQAKPLCSRAAPLLYFNLGAELVYLIDYYWRLVRPKQTRVRQAVLSNVLTLLLSDDQLALLRSCARQLTWTDAHSFLTQLLRHSLIKIHPEEEFISLPLLIDVVFNSFIWQVSQCRPAYHLLFYTLNHCDTLLVMLKRPPALSENLQARVQLHQFCNYFKQTYPRLPSLEIGRIHSWLLQVFDALPAVQMNRLKPFIDCGLSVGKVTAFLHQPKPEQLANVRELPGNYELLDPFNYAGQRLITLGKSIFELCKDDSDGVCKTSRLSNKQSPLSPDEMRTKQTPVADTKQEDNEDRASVRVITDSKSETGISSGSLPPRLAKIRFQVRSNPGRFDKRGLTEDQRLLQCAAALLEVSHERASEVLARKTRDILEKPCGHLDTIAMMAEFEVLLVSLEDGERW